MKKVVTVRMLKEDEMKTVFTKKELQKLIDAKNIIYVCVNNVITFNMNKAMEYLR